MPICLITGASRGIGRGCATVLAEAGYDIGINYRSDATSAEETKRQVEALGRRAILLQADVSDIDQVEAMFDRTAAELGPVDAFVSNAVYSDRELLLDADLAGFRKTIDVTMWGAFHGLRAASMRMAKRHEESGTGGAIIIMSSPHAVIPIPTAMAYNMAKAAIDHMARTAAIELAPHRIRVNVVHPGWIDTPGERKFFSEEQIEAGAQSLPWGRLGTAEEVGKCVRYILSDDADYMTGSTVTLDGGVSLPWWSNRAEGSQ